MLGRIQTELPRYWEQSQILQTDSSLGGLDKQQVSCLEIELLPHYHATSLQSIKLIVKFGESPPVSQSQPSVAYWTSGDHNFSFHSRLFWKHKLWTTRYLYRLLLFRDLPQPSGPLTLLQLTFHLPSWQGECLILGHGSHGAYFQPQRNLSSHGSWLKRGLYLISVNLYSHTCYSPLH